MKHLMIYCGICGALLLAALFASRSCSNAILAGLFATTIILIAAICRHAK